MERFGSAVDAFARLVCDTSRFNGEHSDGADEGVGEGGAYAHGEQVRRFLSRSRVEIVARLPSLSVL